MVTLIFLLTNSKHYFHNPKLPSYICGAMNKVTSNKPEVVKWYSRQRGLYGSEKILLDELTQKLQEAVFLDIGIGGGRTTFHIAPKVKEYVGIDYAEEMIKLSSAEFSASNSSFYVMDAMDMSQFENLKFDIILFSFNGIDYLDFNGRATAIKEIYRILKPGGTFIVSTHNSRKLSNLYSFAYIKNPWAWLKKIKTTIRLKKINGPMHQFEGKDFFIIKDGAEDFGLDVAYIKPEYFINIMNEYGFGLTRILQYNTGAEIKKENISQVKDPWIYYSFTKQ